MTNIFSRRKYILLTFVIILLTAGFILMAGPGTSNAEFNDSIFSFRRLTLTPIVVLSAYGLLVFTIFTKK